MNNEWKPFVWRLLCDFAAVLLLVKSEYLVCLSAAVLFMRPILLTTFSCVHYFVVVVVVVILVGFFVCVHSK